MLKYIFPALMVIGAVGSMIFNLINNRTDYATTLQWLGAALLYTGLLLRS